MLSMLFPNPQKKVSENKTRIVHLAQLHGHGENDLYEDIAMSQFQIAQTILANPDALVLAEDLPYNITKNNYTYNHKYYGEFSNEIIRKIINHFPQGLPKKYSELSTVQKIDLIKYGAPHVLFSLNVLNAIYRTTDTRACEKTGDKVKERFGDVSFSTKLYYTFTNRDLLSEDPQLKALIFDEREETALMFAQEAVRKSEKINPLVLMVYGEAHLFGVKINQMNNPNIIYEGRVESGDLNFFSKIKNDKIFPAGVNINEADTMIPTEKYVKIIAYYRTKYQSQSYFKNGYRSPAMKELVNYLGLIFEKNKKEISYQEILKLLVRSEISRAQLFKDGPSSNQNITHATDKVILDLRQAFIDANLEKNKEIAENKSMPESPSIFNVIFG